MKLVSVLVPALLAVVTFGVLAQGIAPRAVDDSQTQALKAQVAELQQRLAALEVRVDEINQPRMLKAAP